MTGLLSQRYKRLPVTIYLLTACQAYLFISSTLLITVSALIGLELAENKALATLPLALQFIAVMSCSVPASLAMGRWGRRNGFYFAALVGIVGACLALLAIYQHSLWLFCIATFCFGCFTAFGNYYRFTAPEIVPAEKKNVAISWVMAGGVFAAFIGPNLARWSQDMMEVSRYAGAFVIVIGVYLLSLLTVSFMDLPDAVQSKDSGNKGRPLISIILQPIFVVACLCATLGYATMNLIMTATPLAMHSQQMNLGDTAFVIQWHVVAMFAPSFFTGNLINYFGIGKILLSGALLCLLCVILNLAGQTLWHFWSALVLLGLGWNFLFVGGTTLLTECYSDLEKSRTQAANDFIVFSTVSVTALSSGAIHHHLGWSIVNYCVLPLITCCAISALWLIKNRLSTRPNYAG